MRRRSLIALLAALTARGSGEPVFEVTDLPRLVLQKEEAPKGTTLLDDSSGYRSIEVFAEDDQEQTDLLVAGFVSSYVNTFLAPELFGEHRLNPAASLAVSYAILFDDAGAAERGIEVVKQDLLRDGTDLIGREAPPFGSDGFGLYGDLQAGRPPGFAFVWRIGNVVQALVAAGARGAIREEAALTLARAMATRAERLR